MEKRVLFVTLSLAGGGAERVVSILSSELAEQGRDVHLILYDRKNNEYPLSSKVKLQELSRPIGSNPLSRLFNRVIELRRIIKEITPDIVIPFLAKPTEHVFFATRGMRLKFIATVRNNPKLYPSSSGLRYVANWITRHSDAIMLQTAEQASYFKTESDRVFVVPNPVKQEMIDTQYQYKTSIHTIATFGRLNEQKNHELLINAFSVFCKRYPEFELNIWGEGEKKSVLEKLICDKKMSDKIHLCGNTSKVKDELLNTDIFVLSSNYEGLPNSLMEAMAVGVPVISTDCPTGPKDLITNKENGILVTSDSVDELVNALKLLASDYQLRKYIGQNAKKYMKNFTASEIAKGFWRDIN